MLALVTLIGIVLVIVGTAMFSTAAALIVAGVMLITLGTGASGA